MAVIPSRHTGSVIKPIIYSGLLVGTLDITAAVVNYMLSTGKNPMGVFQFVASGAFGKEAFQGGKEMLFWGLLFHFTIAFSFTIAYYLLYPHVRLMQQQPVLSGLLYGALIWLIMSQLVLPLTNVPHLAFKWRPAITGAIILMLAIGLPLGLMARSYYTKKP